MSDKPSPYDLSYGRQMREQMSGQTPSQPDYKKTAEHVAQVLGFVANQHKEAIIHDMYTMIKREADNQLDGYVLSLVRCMEHELAWYCISTAFKQANRPIPDKYYARFNRKRTEDEIPEPKMRVE